MVSGSGDTVESEPAVDARKRLERLSHLASDAGALTVASEASLLLARTEQGLFYVACLGQFKRGKSTLINALLGEPVLPSGVLPVTSVPTVVRHGTRRSARVRFATGEWRSVELSTIAAYASESENPGNTRGVMGIEVFHPDSLLASGLCLVDTPGVGSVFEANSAATRSFLPHVDAALIVIGADPPLSSDELALVKEIAPRVGRMEFVLNKADRLSEPDREAARRFAQEILSDALDREIPSILEISATEGHQGHWAAQLDVLRGRLERLGREAGADLVSRAAERGLLRLLDRIRAELAERQKTLLRPLEESESRIARLQGSVAEAERALKDLRFLFDSEQAQLSSVFQRSRAEFLDSAIPEAVSELDGSLAGADFPARDAPALARRIARKKIEGWLLRVEPAAEIRYRAAMQRFVEIANEFFESLEASGASPADEESRRMEPESGFRSPRRFYFVDLFELAPSESVLRSVLRSDGRTRSETEQYLEHLLQHNSTRVVNDFDERTTESRRRLEGEISARIRERLDRAVHALERARRVRSGGTIAVEAELQRLRTLEEKVADFSAECPIATTGFLTK